MTKNPKGKVRVKAKAKITAKYLRRVKPITQTLYKDSIERR